MAERESASVPAITTEVHTSETVQTPTTATPPEPTGTGVTTFTAAQQAEIDRLMGTARKEGRQAAAKEATDKATADAARERGEWEKVAKANDTRVAELEAEIAKRDREAMIRRVASKHKLPEALAVRLTGDTEADLENDAKGLAKLIEERAVPDTGAGEGDRSVGARASRPGAQSSDAATKAAAYKFTDGQIRVPFPPAS